MKKMLFTVAMCLLALGLNAQENMNILLGDQQVVAPKFIGEKVETEPLKPATNQSAICCYLQEHLPSDIRINANSAEGTVAIEFTVNKDGSLSDFIVANHVSYELDESVIDCIKQTEGMWKAGETNGIPTAMEKRVYVKFDAPGNPSFESITKGLYFSAIRKHNKADYVQNNKLIDTEKQIKKTQRLYRQSLANLERATVYMPNDPTLAYWKAVSYENLGRHKEMIDMLERRQELLSMHLDEQNLNDYHDLVTINTK